MSDGNTTVVEDYRKSLILEVKNFDELDRFLKYEENEEDRKNLKEDILKLKSLEESQQEEIQKLEESIYPRLENLDKKRFEKLEKKIFSLLEKDVKSKWTKELRGKIELLKKKKEFEKKENAKKEKIKQKGEAKKEKIKQIKIKQINCWMRVGTATLIILSLLNLDSFSFIASGASIVALIFTVLFYIVPTLKGIKRFKIKLPDAIIKGIIATFIVILITIVGIFYPQRISLFNWLGSIATLIGFILLFLFFFYDKKLLTCWWEKNLKIETFNIRILVRGWIEKRTFKINILKMTIILALIGFCICIYKYTITGTIKFRDVKHTAEIKLIKEEDGKKQEIASTKTDNDGKFALQYPIGTDKTKTKLIITYDPESTVEDSKFSDHFSQILVSLLFGEKETIDDDFVCNTNKINYETELKEYVEIPDIPIAGKWQCMLENLIFNLKFNHDNDKDGLIVRQNGEKGTISSFFDKQKVTYHRETITFIEPYINKRFKKITGSLKKEANKINEMELEAKVSQNIIKESFKLTEDSFKKMRKDKIFLDIITKLEKIKYENYYSLDTLVRHVLKNEKYEEMIKKYADKRDNAEEYLQIRCLPCSNTKTNK